MDPELYRALKEKIASLDNTVTRVPIPEGTRPTTLKHRILRGTAELSIPVTVRRVLGGLLFWRLTDEDLSWSSKNRHSVKPPQLISQIHWD
jgi:hypothetical protein